MKRISSLALILPVLAIPIAFDVACTVTTNDDNADSGILPTPDSGVITTDSGADADASTLPFVPSNFDPTTIDMTAATDVNVAGTNGGCELNTDDPSTFKCNNQDTPFGVAVKQVAQPNGAPTVVVIGVKSFTVAAGVTLAIGGTHPLVIYSQGAVSVAGTINASASGSTEGNGSLHAGGLGEPPAPVAASKLGSAGASFCGTGGDGAPLGTGATFGTNHLVAYGNTTLIPLYGGSAGGNHASTGYGGGAVQITSLVSIDVSGEIEANGSGGNPGDTTIGGGGGGSGGAILLESLTVTGTGKLFANGGGGGSTTTAGTTGLETTTAAPGGAPSGGAGSDTTTVNGVPGSQVNTGSGSDNGGGGGGAGYIRINTTTGASGFTGSASPGLTSTCGTQGTLTH
jgi:hypothetical protein